MTPQPEAKCGCKIVESFGGAVGQYTLQQNRYIAYCPLHSCAGELLEMLKTYHTKDYIHSLFPQEECLVCDLIARAERKETEKI